jgi:hypothetical protein
MRLRIRWWRRSREAVLSTWYDVGLVPENLGRTAFVVLTLGLPGNSDLGNLVGEASAKHTRLTYHRTWETGLRVAIRVTTFSPDFFVSDFSLLPISLLINALTVLERRSGSVRRDGEKDYSENKNTTTGAEAHVHSGGLTRR